MNEQHSLYFEPSKAAASSLTDEEKHFLELADEGWEVVYDPLDYITRPWNGGSCYEKVKAIQLEKKGNE